jgi:hypothetical protein
VPDEDLEKEVPADSFSVPTSREVLIGPLENMLKKNPYLGLISEAERTIMQRTMVWEKLQKFVDECEGQIAHLAYLRSTFDVFAKSFTLQRTSDFQWKMQMAKTKFLITELEDCKQKRKELSSKHESLNSVMLALHSLLQYDAPELKALSACVRAKNAAWVDYTFDLDKTQNRLLVHMTAGTLGRTRTEWIGSE